LSRFNTVLLICAILFAGANNAIGDTIHLTEGFLSYEPASAAVLVIPEPVSVLAFIGSDGGHSPGWSCVFDCVPGTVVNTSTAEHDFDVDFTIDGVNYSGTGDLSVTAGNVVVPEPPEPDDFETTRTSRFTFEGTLSGQTVDGQRRTLRLLGRGTLGITFLPSSVPGTTRYGESVYGFSSPTPELSTVCLIAAALFGVALLRGAERRFGVS